MDNNNTKAIRKAGKQTGASGTTIYNGIITGEEYNRRLVGKVGLRQYDIMRRSDSTVRAILQLCKLPIIGATWTVEPASDEQSDKDLADMINVQLKENNINFTDFLRQALTMLDFGFSVHEKTFYLTQHNGKDIIGLKSLGFRKQMSVEYWETKEKQPGIQQRLMGDVRPEEGNLDNLVSIPQEKLVVFSNDREGDNYEGISLLRSAFKDWDMKDKLTIVNAIALERLGTGTPLLNIPTNADSGDKELARQAVRQMRANEESYIEVPEGYTVEMLDMKGNTTRDIIPTIQYHDRQIALSVLGQMLMLGASDASGSRAVSTDQSQLFMLSEQALADNVRATIQNQIIKPLVDMNVSGLKNGYPQLKVSKIEQTDVLSLADALQKLSSASLIKPNVATEQYLRNTMHLPELTEEDKKQREEEMAAAKELQQKAADGGMEKEETKPTPAKNKEDIKASVMSDARKVRQRLIDTLVS